MNKLSSKLTLFVCINIACVCGVNAYSQVLLAGSNSPQNEGPKIFKALNVDLIHPKTFNSSENVISTTQTATTKTTTTEPTLSLSLLSDYYDLQQQQPHETPPPPSLIYVTPANDALNALNAPNAPAPASSSSLSSSSSSPLLPRIVAIENSKLSQNNEQEQQHQQREQVEQIEQIEQQQQQQQQEEQQLLQYASTGRAIDYRPTYHQFNQLIPPLIQNSQPHPLRPSYGGRGHSDGQQQQQTQRLRLNTHPVIAYSRSPPQTQSASGISKIIYPQAYQQQQPLQRPINREDINKMQGKAQISDRFTPGEAVASSQFKNHRQHHNHDHSHSNSNGNGNKVAASSNFVQSYVPPKNLYSFPPNINAKYPAPAQDPKATLPSSSVNSYAAPPSGPLSNSAGFPLATASSNSNGYKYEGPVSPAYLPPAVPIANDAPKDEQKGGNGGGAGDVDTEDNGDDTIGVLPASAMDTGNDSNDMNSGSAIPDMSSDNMNENTDGVEHDHHDDHDDHGHPLTGYDTGKEYPTPPPGWLEEHPDSAHHHPPAHDHGHNFDYQGHFPSYPLSYPHIYPHQYPEIIYDDHDHHHHHDETPPPPTFPPITTEIPPEPAPEPRVKKYSYFYIGRKLWYIPLYFTVWFSFYVLWLILKSIARHKVNLPNHYVNRRSLPEYNEDNLQEYINQLTVSVLEKIDGFKTKYAT